MSFARIVAAAGLLLAGSQFAVAQQPASDAAALDPTLPKALAKGLQAGRGKLAATFKAAGGLTGYVIVDTPGRNEIVYTVPGSGLLIVGHVLDAEGKDLNQTYVDQYAPKIDYAKFESRIVSAPSVVEGATGSAVKSTIYIFMDPNCIFCHLTWKALRPYEAAGLQVRWIPMGLLKPDSAGKAAALLDSHAGAMLLEDGEASFDVTHESVGIAAETNVSNDTQAKIKANEALFRELGFYGTPTIFYRGKDGKLTPSQGMVRLSEIPSMTGLPEQKIDDPSLTRFR